MYAATGTLKNIQANTLFIDMIRNSAGSRGYPWRGWCWHVRTIDVLKSWLWDWCLYISVWNKGYKGKWIMYILVFSFPLRSCICDSMITEQLPYVKGNSKVFMPSFTCISKSKYCIHKRSCNCLSFLFFLMFLSICRFKVFSKVLYICLICTLHLLPAQW